MNSCFPHKYSSANFSFFNKICEKLRKAFPGVVNSKLLLSKIINLLLFISRIFISFKLFLCEHTSLYFSADSYKKSLYSTSDFLGLGNASFNPTLYSKYVILFILLFSLFLILFENINRNDDFLFVFYITFIIITRNILFIISVTKKIKIFTIPIKGKIKLCYIRCIIISFPFFFAISNSIIMHIHIIFFHTI